MRVEVRCCCQPQKLLGWLEVPSPTIHDGQWVTFLVVPQCGGGLDGGLWEGGQRLALQICKWYDVGAVYYGLALKAEGAPVEVLRRIRGFTEGTAEGER